MQERIRIRFTRAGVPLQISHLGDDGIVFAFESSAKPLGFAIGLTPANEIVSSLMARVRQDEDWAYDVFNLTVTRDDDSLVISGGGKKKPGRSLPPGRYMLRFAVSETRLRDELAAIDIPENGEAQVLLHEVPPSRQLVVVDRMQWDPEARAACEHQNSRIDGMDPFSWLAQPQPRIARKACLLNLLAKARSLPSARSGESLCALIESVRWADVDRVAVTASPGLLPALHGLPAWRDNGPIHPSHGPNLARVFGGSPQDYALESFREPESGRSMQVICATHRTSGRVVAELDIDLGNPKIDLIGFVTHVGELLDPGRTNHLSLFDALAGGRTADFLYYRLEQALAHPSGV